MADDLATQWTAFVTAVRADLPIGRDVDMLKAHDADLSFEFPFTDVNGTQSWRPARVTEAELRDWNRPLVLRVVRDLTRETPG